VWKSIFHINQLLYLQTKASVRGGGVIAHLPKGDAENAGVENAGVVNAGVENAGVENAGVENAGVENAGVDSRGIAKDELSR